VWTILKNLNVIDNNISIAIGGGPNSDTTNRRAPMAPPFIPLTPTKNRASSAVNFGPV